MKNCININGQRIGNEQPPYIVAEMSGNHNGKLENALKIVEVAKHSGANAVKIQTYRPDTITINHDSPEFIIKEGLWKNRRLYDLYQEAHTPWEWHKEIYNYAREIGITLFSSPFDKTAVDFLEELNNPAYKVASPELIDLQLIKYIASTGKPIIFSTGMATFEEIGEAIDAASSKGCKDIIVLHCTSSYPAPLDQSNLSTIKQIEQDFNVISGLSDHSEGTIISTIAVGLGASMIEKHFTLDRSHGGVDSKFSIEPNELSKLVKDASIASNSLGKPAFKPTDAESGVLKHRRSLYIIRDIKRGDKFTESNIKSIRPGNGMKPKFIDNVLGKRASKDLFFGQPLSKDMIDEY